MQQEVTIKLPASVQLNAFEIAMTLAANPDNSQPKQKKECKFLSLSQLEEKKIKNQHSKNDG